MYPSYTAMHLRIRRSLGSASAHPCRTCGGRARDWAYDHQDPNELTGRNNEGRAVQYSADLARYQPLCRTCHSRTDAEASGAVAPAMLRHIESAGVANRRDLLTRFGPHAATYLARYVKAGRVERAGRGRYRLAKQVAEAGQAWAPQLEW